MYQFVGGALNFYGTIMRTVSGVVCCWTVAYMPICTNCFSVPKLILSFRRFYFYSWSSCVHQPSCAAEEA